MCTIDSNFELMFYLINFSWKAIIVSCCGCFHGRTLAAISMSCDNEATHGFWPLLPGQLKVDFGDSAALEKIFKGRYSSEMKYLKRKLVKYFLYPLKLPKTKLTVIGGILFCVTR